MELLTTAALARLHPTDRLRSGERHPERQERLEALAALRPTEVERRATLEQLLRVHDAAYLERLQAIAEPTFLDADTPADATSWEAAVLSAGLALEAVDRGGFGLGRPPGHHALADSQKGFCLLNNLAIAARYAQRELGVGRVAIVDFDVHHGNGAEAIFRDDESVMTVSLHEWPNVWSDLGGLDGNDAGNLNVPLDAGAGDEEHLRAFDDVVAPAVTAFAPELVLVAAGFDAAAVDDVSKQRVSADGFTELAARCRALGPRIAVMLEGGYDLVALPQLVAAAHEGFRRS